MKHWPSSLLRAFATERQTQHLNSQNYFFEVLPSSAYKKVLRWGTSMHQQNLTLLSGAAEADSRDLKPSKKWDSEERRREPARNRSSNQHTG
jgi:hypothetical protein